jgi:hypothetical protein
LDDGSSSWSTALAVPHRQSPGQLNDSFSP